MRPTQTRFILLCAATLTLPWAAHAADSGTVQAKWKPQEVRYSYSGFTTAYNCDAAEQKVKSILTEAGAHPQTKVRATGCIRNRPQRNFFITITTATPVPASEPDDAKLGQSEQELLERMGAKNVVSREQFAATWKTINLSTDRKLDLQPGDCELMEGLRDHVFPKLQIKVVSDKVQCTPKQLSIQTPELKVSALVRAPSADEAMKQKT